MKKTISVLAGGDSFITRRIARGDARMLRLRELLQGYDVRFTNLEVALHHFDVSPSAVSGGTWAAARPGALEDLQWLGFNMFAWANNHTLDWTYDGLLSTRRYLNAAGCAHAGAGIHLAEAAQPAYIDLPEGRAALIGVTSSAPDWHMAGEQRPDLPGRPGVNGLRAVAVHRVKADDLEVLRRIAAQTEVNAKRLLDEKEGFQKPAEGLMVGPLRFEAGEPGTQTKVNDRDGQRIARSIREAARQADVVLVSHHAHEMKGMDKDAPADFCRDFARLCIDSGAHAYLGHGPHILRGIEIYKRRPIFYSLGDFIFENDSVERQPAEFYDLYGLGPQNTPSDGFDRRSGGGVRGLAADPRVFESVLAAVEISDGQIDSLRLIPIALGFAAGRSLKGKPYLAAGGEGEAILRRLQRLAQAFQTEIEMKDGCGVVKF